MKQALLFEDNKEVQKPINVASVPMRSPFRYAGGKTWFVPYFRKWLKSKQTKNIKLIEPFAGGGIISLTAAFENLADSILMVEKDEDVAAVWRTIFSSQYKWLVNKIINFEVTAGNANEIISQKPKSLREHGFQTILRNRLQHGGILANGAGLLKNGENGKGLKSRWYPETLKRRIVEIQAAKHKIQFLEGDAFQVIKEYSKDSNAVFFVDPPYTVAGRRLYKYHTINHNELFKCISEVKGDFILTYDDAEEIEKLAKQYNLKVKRVIMKTTHHVPKYELVIGKNLEW